MSSGKKTQGRKKIDMTTKISNESALQVSFSKRRSGLFKKANELFTLCGTYIARKAFSFGHPDIYAVIGRFLSWVPYQINRVRQFIEATRNANVRELNAHLTLLNDALDIEKKCCDDLSHLCRMTEDLSWWSCPVDGMNIAQLELLKNAFEELNNHVAQQADPTQSGQAQMLSTIFFQNPMSEPHLLSFNNMRGWGHGPSGSF